MAKRKDSVALFEVIKGKEKRNEYMNVPGWMQKNQPKPAAEQPAGGEVAGQEKDDPEVQPEQNAQQPLQPGSPRPAASPSANLLMMTREGVKFSLKRNMLYVGALVLLVLLTSVFMAGRASKGGNEADPGPVPAKNAEAGIAAEANSTADPAVQRVLGKYYLVIQDVLGHSQVHQEKARAIVSFLASNNEPASVRLWSVDKKPTFVVWSAKTFNSADEPAAKEYVRRIEKLGEQYMKQGGYNFKQSGKPWFLICTESLLKEPQQLDTGKVSR